MGILFTLMRLLDPTQGPGLVAGRADPVIKGLDLSAQAPNLWGKVREEGLEVESANGQWFSQSWLCSAALTKPRRTSIFTCFAFCFSEIVSCLKNTYVPKEQFLVPSSQALNHPKAPGGQKPLYSRPCPLHLFICRLTCILYSVLCVFWSSVRPLAN